MTDNKCSKCGFVMIEEFDYRPGPNDITLAIPKGTYTCGHCKAEPPLNQEKP